MSTFDPNLSSSAPKAHTLGADEPPRFGRMRLLRLAVSCPRCGARPAVRVTPILVKMLSGEPAELHLATYQCHRQKCGYVYDITAGAYQRSS
jgi:rubredoxin